MGIGGGAGSLAAALVLVLLAPGAQAREVDGPTASGPLVPTAAGCDEESSSTRWSCEWHYELPAETNATEDYSVSWIQLGIDPPPGWCAEHIGYHVELPETARIVSVAPDRAGSFPRPAKERTELVADAEGMAPVPGRIYEDARIGKGRTRLDWGPRRFAYEWRGRSRGRVYVTLGLQIADRRIPPHLVGMWGEGASFGIGTCRPVPLRSGR